jgi:hypothetical protein
VRHNSKQAWLILAAGHVRKIIFGMTVLSKSRIDATTFRTSMALRFFSESDLPVLLRPFSSLFSIQERDEVLRALVVT